VVATGLALPTLAQAPAADDKFTVNFVNADIQAGIKTVRQQHGNKFLLRPGVPGPREDPAGGWRTSHRLRTRLRPRGNNGL